MDNQLVLFWNEKAAELLNWHTTPGHDARRFAIVQIAVHDALNSIKPWYNRYTYKPDINWYASPEAAVNGAASEALKWAVEDISNFILKLPPPARAPFSDFNANNCYNKIEGWYKEKMGINYIPEGIDKETGKDIGVASAKAIILLRKNDGCDQVVVISDMADGINPPQFRGDYYDFPPSSKKLFVNFRTVVPFVIKNAVQFRQELNYSASEIASNYMDSELAEVEEKGTEHYVINNLTPQEKLEVDFWSNLRQHIVWNNFAAELIKTTSFDAWKTARIFALIHTAMADGAISMFKDVYEFYNWRPVTAIHYKLNGHPITNPKWTSYLKTTRVPEYPSAFGILGGATGEVLKSFFPEVVNISLIRLTPNLYTLKYRTISEAVLANMATKINCGWNFRKTILPSIEQGRQIGQYV